MLGMEVCVVTETVTGMIAVEVESTTIGGRNMPLPSKIPSSSSSYSLRCHLSLHNSLEQ